MNNIIIVGAGGLAADIISYLSSHNESVTGILCDYEEDYNNLKTNINYLGEIDNYKIGKDDRFIVAIGKNPDRKKIFHNLLVRDAIFHTFIHQTAIICNNVRIGNGVIIGPYCIVGSNCIIDDGCFLNKYCSVGHDSIIEKNSIVGPFGMIGGKCHIDKSSTLSSRSTIFPGVRVGSNCVISAHCVVRKNVNDDTLLLSENLSKKNKSY